MGLWNRYYETPAWKFDDTFCGEFSATSAHTLNVASFKICGEKTLIGAKRSLNERGRGTLSEQFFSKDLPWNKKQSQTNSSSVQSDKI